MDTYLKQCRWGNFLLIRGDLISEYVNLYGEWCEGEVELFARLLPEDGVAIEVGSNIGMHATPLSHFCRKGKLFCYEPQRVVFQILCANLALNNRLNVIARPCAVGAENAVIEIESGACDAPWNYGAFSLARGYSAEGLYRGAVAKEPVQLVRLDDDMAAHAIGRLDLLKIDSEGCETEALRGASALIARFKPYIFVENNAPERFDSVLDDIRGRGYRCYWYCSSRSRPNNFNKAFWIMHGQDINMLCVAEEKPQPADLVPVESLRDLDLGKVPLY